MGKHGQYGALVALCLCAAPAAAGCRLALALGFDVSRSVDAADYRIMQAGLAAALRAPDVQRAALAPPDHVSIAVYEWSGRDMQVPVLPWTEVRSAADLEAMARAVEGHARSDRMLPTGLGAALAHGHGLLAGAPPCAARTLDIAGDGQNNDGIPPARIYETHDFTGITVNGLSIGGHERDIRPYYQAEVIHGPGAFVEPAPTQADFPAAIRRKLEKELAPRLMGALIGTGPVLMRQ